MLTNVSWNYKTDIVVGSFLSQPHLKGCGDKPTKPDESNSDDNDLLKKILSQHPTTTFTTVNSFLNFYPTIVDDIKQVINQPEEKINAATEKALKTTLDLIRERRNENVIIHPTIFKSFVLIYQKTIYLTVGLS